MKVLKFGGSSMADAAQYRKVKEIVAADPGRQVVVVSAPGKRFPDDHKITDLLYLCNAHIKYGVDCTPVFQIIQDRFLGIRDELGLEVELEAEFAQFKTDLEAKKLSEDEIVSRGEYFSAKLLAAYLGFAFLDATKWVRFKFDGNVNQQATYEALQDKIQLPGIVIPGFYGTMPDGRIKTFSRGGSDITGALAAAAFSADVYENWTDVSGILMADPRIIDDPRTIPFITYAELRQLSFFGAQVLHEHTIFPVREKGIPINIRNTNNPQHPGTMIQDDFDLRENQLFLTGITGKQDFTIVSLEKNGMSNEVGTCRKILSVFEDYNVPVEYITNGIDSVSFAIPSEAIAKNLYAVMNEIRKAVSLMHSMFMNVLPSSESSGAIWLPAQAHRGKSLPPSEKPGSTSV
ncbi:aspartate kinase [Arcanobacterium hippocoleae]|uniref:amino acid kinase family protein n=1 Tax=Arcanobacterium hippocoleae TaxID=149017 RepID=UPI00333FAD73